MAEIDLQKFTSELGQDATTSDASAAFNEQFERDITQEELLQFTQFRSTPETYELSNLEPTSPIEVPETQFADDGQALRSGTDPLLTNAQSIYDQAFQQATDATQVQQAEDRESSLTRRLEEQLETLTGQGQAVLDEEAKLGLPQSIERLQQSNLQIAQLQAEFDNILAGTTDRRAGVPLGMVEGEQARIRRQKATELGGLAMVNAALQGNIQLAQQTAERTVALEFQDEQQRVSNMRELLELNRETLSREETKRANNLEFVLNERQTKIDEQKEERLGIMNVAIRASEFNAPADVLANISKATNLFDALTAASGYMAEADVETGNWNIFQNKDGTTMMFDKNTGLIKQVNGATLNADGTLMSGPVSSMSDEYFTDGSGVSWNMSGWATDPTKVAQMQAIADKIGKLTEENLDSKVQQLAPGITGDMIRQASAQTGVSWEAILTSVVQEATVGGKMSNVANKNNNFGGLTWSSKTRWQQPPYNGTIGTARPSAEGGNYISFPSKEEGVLAMAALMASYGTTDPNRPTNDPVIQGYIDQVKSGDLTLNQALNEIDKTKKEAFIVALNKVAAQPEDVDQKQKSLGDLAGTLGSHTGLDQAVGPRNFNRITFDKGDRNAFLGDVNRLVEAVAFQELIRLKGEGATFGSLTEGERKSIQGSITPIAFWEVTRKDGKITGYEVSEKAFKAELLRVQQLLYEQSGFNAFNTLSDDIKTTSDGFTWEMNADGSLTQIGNSTTSNL